VLTAVEKLGKLQGLPLEKSSSDLTMNYDQAISIDMKGVSVADNDHPTSIGLHDINLLIPSGSKVCLMGKSDSGKHELIHFIAGYQTAYQGRFSIGQISFADINVREYRKQLGVYFQLHDIFEGTVYDNLTMGDKEIPMEKIVKLARSIGLDELITQLPNGYSTWLYAKGKSMSRSARMKMMICRALLKHPKLLLLEEPFEHLDLDDHHKLSETIGSVANNVTMVVATNNQNFAAQCDMVVYMEKGKIKAAGTWNEVKSMMHL
jgi:ABC-type bacteriocin/lantibiotic exporter with double-glycine peptidase domain